ncbi:MAG: ATP-binding protein [Ruminiclostridium sp.]|nr:ATP-binding protein [Ruminiclostridium sp.]
MTEKGKEIMTCGRICSGKSTYARKLREEYRAVILSVDEITLALFGNDAGEKHDEYVERLKNYLYGKSVEIVGTGTNVILDWGFWTRKERDYARRFYTERGIACELHYLSISDEEWERRIKQRNDYISEGRTSAYYVDDGLKAKFAAIFEPPGEHEADVVLNA